MKVKLVIVSPEVQPNEYDITLPTKIGRGHEAKLKLVHPLVSRLHCELFAEGEQVMVRDLDSLNGTFVDQQRLDQDMPLASGATVMMGTVMFRVVYGADADRLPPPAVADLDKTVAAPGTVRQETLAKIAKAGKPVTAADLWDEEAEEPTTIVTPGDEEALDLAFLDDETTEEQPKPAAAKPAPAAKPAQPAAAPKPAPPASKAPVPAKPAAPAVSPAADPGAKTVPAVKPPAPAPAKPAPAAPAKNSADDDVIAGSDDEDADDDLDDFFKSIM